MILLTLVYSGMFGAHCLAARDADAAAARCICLRSYFLRTYPIFASSSVFSPYFVGSVGSSAYLPLFSFLNSSLSLSCCGPAYSFHIQAAMPVFAVFLEPNPFSINVHAFGFLSNRRVPMEDGNEVLVSSVCVRR